MSNVVDLIVITVLFSVVLVITFIAVVPLGGNIVRVRAQYTPKVVQLDPENSTDAPGRSVMKSYWGMMRRIYRLEGWRGLLKGIGALQRWCTLSI
ncbi:hypothetical protein BS17DRAFT_708970 [Gyrodon lividus]|nr:hypothetical protein BS17DRAFT_708970 [Gyrodon lividus]